MDKRSIDVNYVYYEREDGSTAFLFEGGHKNPVRDRNNNLERWALINEVVKAEKKTGWPMGGAWVAVLEGDIEEARKAVEQMRKDYKLP